MSSTKRRLSVSNYSDAESSCEGSLSGQKPRKTPRTMIQIDWRSQICDSLNLKPDVPDEVLLTSLEEATETLEEAKRASARSTLQPQISNLEYPTLHRVACDYEDEVQLYLDPPWLVKSGPQDAHLRGSNAVDDLDLYITDNDNIPFISYKDYKCCYERQADRTPITAPSELLTKKSVCMISEYFTSAMTALSEKAFSRIPHSPFEPLAEFDSPYYWWFHGRSQIAKCFRTLDLEFQNQIRFFQNYITDELGDIWDEVDMMLAAGKVSFKYIEYLYVPNTVNLVIPEDGNLQQCQAFVATSWLHKSRDDDRVNAARHAIMNLTGSSWEFDGKLYKVHKWYNLGTLPSLNDLFNIRELKVYPVRFATTELKKQLRSRGEIFWKCRRQNYVGYSSCTEVPIQSSSAPRYMIDMAIYNYMHPSKETNKSPRDELEPELMSCDAPPASNEIVLCLPSTIYGYNLHKKDWVTLNVSQIKDVQWDTAAFKSLVIDEEAKEIVTALITNKIHAEKATDMMSGKGNGLFILLHGGPGTGKTLTAESVAEYAKKPLYRVTCGDIGTTAEQVEKYLEVVMLLGNTWGCVVLLDEADIFLEQRTLNDLQRNALVSVFLRVLEYYEGSNRVGTFDEAFKSRIQLTLHYKNLDESQRFKIWENFISRLEGFDALPEPDVKLNGDNIDYGINSREIRAMLPELAKEPLNGREIRNVITTARQLAMFRKEPVNPHHLQKVIREAKKFDDYLLKLRHNFTNDQIKRDRGERL